MRDVDRRVSRDGGVLGLPYTFSHPNLDPNLGGQCHSGRNPLGYYGTVEKAPR